MALIDSDTSPEAEAVQVRVLRGLPPERRLGQAFALTDAVRELARAGLRTRHPGASAEELRRRFAALVLEPDLVKRVYGSDGREEG